VKKNYLKYVLFGLTFFSSSNINSQSLDMLIDFAGEDIIYFEYNYNQFNQFAYLDSSIILKSFSGVQNVYIDSTGSGGATTIKYYLTIHKIGIETKRTFFDTLSVDSINYKFNANIFEVETENFMGGEGYIYGWIFPDSLMESVVDTNDTTPMFPYSKLYRKYNLENDDSLYYKNDTLFIHYRPIATNYNDSYFSIDYTIERNHGLEYYSRHYWSYFGTGFRESYQKTGVALISSISKSKKLPTKNYLSQNYPNPFNPTTTIKYSIPSTQTPLLRGVGGVLTTLKIYDILGREVATLLNKEQKPGNYEIQFDASDLTSGIYFYRLQSGSFVESRKMILIK